MEPVVCYDLFKELNSLKRQIDEEPEKWEYRKRAINPYECIFSSFNPPPREFENTRHIRSDSEWHTVRSGKALRRDIPSQPTRTSISAVRPISRAFFKMTELCNMVRNDTHIESKYIFTNPVRILHLAESPGGFVQSWRWHREREGFLDDATCVTIEKQRGKDPWDRLREVSRNWKHPPRLMLGDLFVESVRNDIGRRFVDEKASVVTGDGGFDFSTDYCSQEEQATPLILAEMVVGLYSLRKGGAFILKVFDVVTLPMLQMLWVFWKCFRSFQLVKPKTSRACNSERYIVARGFRGTDANLTVFLKECNEILKSDVRPIRTLFQSGWNTSWETMDPAFRGGISIVKTLMRNQIHSIRSALRIDPEEPEESRKQREDRSLSISREWCKTYGIPVASSHLIAYPRSLDRCIFPRD